MEARSNNSTICRFCLLAPVMGLAIFVSAPLQAQLKSYRATSTNFVVVAADPNLARKGVKLAEQYRKQLAMEWLGYELATWKQKCPITIEIGPHAGGETSFAFVEGRRCEPTEWQMKIYGPLNRVLDAVLPHEVTHTIFATHFGCPLPRWADEGACTTVEHSSERQKNHRMLIEFLNATPSRGIPFNRMFTMKRYPNDILPLYAQGYSLARFLIGQKGRQHFIKYLEQGIENEQSYNATKVWGDVTKQWYGYKDLSELQIKWLGWVRNGSRDLAIQPNAVAQKSPEPEPAVLASALPTDASLSRSVARIRPPSFVAPSTTESWYVRQSAQPTKPTETFANAPNSIGTEQNIGKAPAFRPGSVGRFVDQKAAGNKSNTLFKYDPNLKRTIWR